MSVESDIRHAITAAVANGVDTETVVDTYPRTAVMAGGGESEERAFGDGSDDSVRRLEVVLEHYDQAATGLLLQDALDDAKDAAETAIYADAGVAALVDDITYVSHETEINYEPGTPTGVMAVTFSAWFTRNE